MAIMALLMIVGKATNRDLFRSRLSRQVDFHWGSPEWGYQTSQLRGKIDKVIMSCNDNFHASRRVATRPLFTQGDISRHCTTYSALRLGRR